MPALGGLPPTLLTIVMIVLLIRLLLPTITECSLVILAMLTSDVDRAERAERLLGILKTAVQPSTAVVEDEPISDDPLHQGVGKVVR